jgi:hypothetical protein
VAPAHVGVVTNMISRMDTGMKKSRTAACSSMQVKTPALAEIEAEPLAKIEA